MTVLRTEGNVTVHSLIDMDTGSLSVRSGETSEDSLGNTTNTEPLAGKDKATSVRPSNSFHCAGRVMVPVTAFHNSGVRPAMRKEALNVRKLST